MNPVFVLIGVLVGGAVSWLFLSRSSARQKKELNERLSNLTLKARNLSCESAALKDKVAFLEEREKDYSDLAGPHAFNGPRTIVQRQNGR